MYVLILYLNGGTYSWKSTSNDKFSRNFSWKFCFYFQNFSQKSAGKEDAKEIFISYFVLLDMYDWRLKSRFISQHTTYWRTATFTGYIVNVLEIYRKTLLNFVVVIQDVCEV